jgi:hypothetical protein
MWYKSQGQVICLAIYIPVAFLKKGGMMPMLKYTLIVFSLAMALTAYTETPESTKSIGATAGFDQALTDK